MLFSPQSWDPLTAPEDQKRRMKTPQMYFDSGVVYNTQNVGCFWVTSGLNIVLV